MEGASSPNLSSIQYPVNLYPLIGHFCKKKNRVWHGKSSHAGNSALGKSNSLQNVSVHLITSKCNNFSIFSCDEQLKEWRRHSRRPCVRACVRPSTIFCIPCLPWDPCLSCLIFSHWDFKQWNGLALTNFCFLKHLRTLSAVMSSSRSESVSNPIRQCEAVLYLAILIVSASLYFEIIISFIFL